jgi:hypothetical protein
VCAHKGERVAGHVDDCNDCIMQLLHNWDQLKIGEDTFFDPITGEHYHYESKFSTLTVSNVWMYIVIVLLAILYTIGVHTYAYSINLDRALISVSMCLHFTVLTLVYRYYAKIKNYVSTLRDAMSVISFLKENWQTLLLFFTSVLALLYYVKKSGAQPKKENMIHEGRFMSMKIVPNFVWDIFNLLRYVSDGRITTMLKSFWDVFFGSKITEDVVFDAEENKVYLLTHEKDKFFLKYRFFPTNTFVCKLLNKDRVFVLRGDNYVSVTCSNIVTIEKLYQEYTSFYIGTRGVTKDEFTVLVSAATVADLTVVGGVGSLEYNVSAAKTENDKIAARLTRNVDHSYNYGNFVPATVNSVGNADNIDIDCQDVDDTEGVVDEGLIYVDGVCDNKGKEKMTDEGIDDVVDTMLRYWTNVKVWCQSQDNKYLIFIVPAIALIIIGIWFYCLHGYVPEGADLKKQRKEKKKNRGATARYYKELVSKTYSGDDTNIVSWTYVGDDNKFAHVGYVWHSIEKTAEQLREIFPDRDVVTIYKVLSGGQPKAQNVILRKPRENFKNEVMMTNLSVEKVLRVESVSDKGERDMITMCHKVTNYLIMPKHCWEKVLECYHAGVALVVLNNRWYDVDKSEVIVINSDLVAVKAPRNFGSLQNCNHSVLKDNKSEECWILGWKDEGFGRMRSFQTKVSVVRKGDTLYYQCDHWPGMCGAVIVKNAPGINVVGVHNQGATGSDSLSCKAQAILTEWQAHGIVQKN